MLQVAAALGPPPVRAAEVGPLRAGQALGQYCCSVEQDQPLQAVASAGYLAGAMDSASAQTSAMASEPSGTWIWYSTRTASAPWFWYWSRRRDDGSLRMTVMSSKSGTQAPAVHVPDPASSKMQQYFFSAVVPAPVVQSWFSTVQVGVVAGPTRRS